MATAFITGIGTAVPPHAIAQHDALAQMADFCAADADQRRAMSRVYLHAGVRSRHSVVLESPTNGEPAQQAFYVSNAGATVIGPGDGTARGGAAVASDAPTTDARMRAYEAAAAPLALQACQAALVDAGAEAGEITHLVTVSCSGFSAPGVDLALMSTLQMCATVERTHVGFMGCHGALNGLRVARAIVEADAAACVLLCAVELCTLHLQGGFTMQRAVSNALFADGAAAVIVRGAAKDKESHDARGTRAHDAGRSFPLGERTLTGDAAPADIGESVRALALVGTGACVIPDSTDAMTWRIGDQGFEMTLSPRVPDYIVAHLPGWIDGWLKKHGLVRGDVAAWVVHPGGPRILSAFCDAMALPTEAVAVSRQVLSQYGNMSSPTILFILQRLWRGDEAGDAANEMTCPQGPIVALGFGPGLAVEAALLRPAEM